MSMATRTDAQSPALHVADGHDVIRVQGVRENDLADISVEAPKRRLTVFTGVSGSGKSSLTDGSVAGRDGVVVIDQGAIRGSRRSNPATYRAARADPQGVREGAAAAGRLPPAGGPPRHPQDLPRRHRPVPAVLAFTTRKAVEKK